LAEVALRKVITLVPSSASLKSGTNNDEISEKRGENVEEERREKNEWHRAQNRGGVEEVEVMEVEGVEGVVVEVEVEEAEVEMEVEMEVEVEAESEAEVEGVPSE